MILPAHIPMNTNAVVTFLFVSPAVFWICHEYINGVMPARNEVR